MYDKECKKFYKIYNMKDKIIKILYTLRLFLLFCEDNKKILPIRQ